MTSKRLLLLAIVIVCSCKPKNDSYSKLPELSNDTVTSPAVNKVQSNPVQSQPPKNQLIIGYKWNEALYGSQKFEPFQKIYKQATLAVQFYDSLWYARNGALSHSDSARIHAALDKSYQSIMRYAELAKSGFQVPKGKVPLRVGVISTDDESYLQLKESLSTTLNKVDFMFLGGAPFVQQDPEVYKDSNGNPETYYLVDVPENGMYLFNYLYSRNPGPMQTSYGPPLSTYNDGPRTNYSINGIGSVIHQLQNKIPVWFLTNDGPVQANVVEVKMNLGDDYGCVSQYPKYTFACSKNIDRASIIGVFYSEQLSVEKSKMLESDNESVAYYDLDGDDVADIARVQSAFDGATESMAAAIWYARINGDWIVIEHAMEPDCT